MSLFSYHQHTPIIAVCQSLFHAPCLPNARLKLRTRKPYSAQAVSFKLWLDRKTYFLSCRPFISCFISSSSFSNPGRIRMVSFWLASTNFLVKMGNFFIYAFPAGDLKKNNSPLISDSVKTSSKTPMNAGLTSSHVTSRSINSFTFFFYSFFLVFFFFFSPRLFPAFSRIMTTLRTWRSPKLCGLSYIALPLPLLRAWKRARQRRRNR